MYSKTSKRLCCKRLYLIHVGNHSSSLFPARHSEVVKFWENVYGFQMSSLAAEVLKEPFVEVVPNNVVATSSHTLVDLNLMTCSTKDYSHISSPFKLEATRDTSITAFAGYFDTFFDLPVENVSFTTGPHGEPTHWKQTVFYLKDPVPVKKGLQIYFSFSIIQ